MAGSSKANQRQSRVNKPRYEAYRNTATREKNKAYKLIKHLEIYPDDTQAEDALDRMQAGDLGYCVRSARKRLKDARKATPEHTFYMK